MNIVITAGGTNEKIDEVRHITNMSSGKLGMEIYSQIDLNLIGSKVFYIYPKGSLFPAKNLYSPNLTLIEVNDTASVEKAVREVITNNKIDVFIHAMAISDYTVDKVFSMDDIINKLSEVASLDKDILADTIRNINGFDKSNKISSKSEEMFLSMKKTPKIIDMIKELDSNIFLISFKLLDGVSNKELIDVAQKQLVRTNSNYVIANDLSEIRLKESHQAYFISELGVEKIVSSKEEIGKEIINIIKEV